jgi:hypothetical protein
MGFFWRDLRYAVRSIIDRPTLSVTAFTLVALGVGGTVAVFQLAWALRQPLPVAEADRLVRIHETRGGQGHYPMSYANFAEKRAWHE